MNRLLYACSVLVNFVASTDSIPPTLDKKLLLKKDKQKHLIQFQTLRKYFLSPKNEPLDYLDKLKSHDMNILENVDNSFKSRASARIFRRLFRYNCLSISDFIGNMMVNTNSYAQRIDLLLRNEMMSGLLNSEIFSKLLSTCKENDKSSFNEITFTFDYINTTLAKINGSHDNFSIFSTSSLIGSFFRSLNDSNFEGSRQNVENTSTDNGKPTLKTADADSPTCEIEKKFLNLIKALNNKIKQIPSTQTSEITSLIDQCRSEFVLLLSKLKLEDKFSELYLKVTIGNVLITRFDLLKLIFCKNSAKLEEYIQIIKNYIKAHLMLSYSEFPTDNSFGLFLNLYKPNNKSPQFSRLIECIDDDIVWENENTIDKVVLESAAREASENVITAKSDNGLLQKAINFLVPSLFHVNEILPYKKDEVYDDEIIFARNYLKSFEDKFDADPRFTSKQEMDRIGLKKQYYFLNYHIHLLDKIHTNKLKIASRSQNEPIAFTFGMADDLMAKILKLFQEITDDKSIDFKGTLFKLEEQTGILLDALRDEDLNSKLYLKILKMNICKLIPSGSKGSISRDEFAEMLEMEKKANPVNFTIVFFSYNFYIFWFIFILNVLLAFVFIYIKKGFNMARTNPAESSVTSPNQ